MLSGLQLDVVLEDTKCSYFFFRFVTVVSLFFLLLIRDTVLYEIGYPSLGQV